MPLFYLHQKTVAETIWDLDGAEFATLAEAWEEAITAARELTSESVRTGVIDLRRSFHIVDEAGVTRMVVPFSDALRVIACTCDPRTT